MIKRVIFDVDGTLIRDINFKPFVERSFTKVGIDPAKADIFMQSVKQYEKENTCYNEILYQLFFEEKLGESLINRNWLKIYFEELKGACKKNPKIEKMIYDLYYDYELVILSNYFEESQRNRLKVMGLNTYFDSYYGEKIIKPYPEAYMDACGKYEPSECVIVGDDPYWDIEVPKKMGFKTIYVNNRDNLQVGKTVKNVEEITPQLIKKLH